MAGNTKEKEKCLEKLNQMQKYLPFLDFMIEKIKEKNNEISLKCQLSKFQLLRSMIAQKNGKYSWDVIIKVEDVIEKLIAKLDFKDQSEKYSQKLSNTDNQNGKTNATSSVTTGPSSTTTVPTANSKPQELSTSMVDLIMKTIKVSADNSVKKSTESGKQLVSNFLGPSQPPDASGKTVETDLDKDLDGFDLTDSESSNSVAECVAPAPEKPPSHDDLLSSSREKLLKSLQSRGLPCRADFVSSKFSAVGRSEKSSEPPSISAFSRTQSTLSEVKSGSDVTEGCDHVVGNKKSRKMLDAPEKAPEKSSPIPWKTPKPFSFPEKFRSPSTTNGGDPNLKQRLKEKFSTDICEVYRVPGKSVGGSLRSLKESPIRKKSFTSEDPDPFKLDKSSDKSDTKLTSVPQSKPFSEKIHCQAFRSCHEESSASGIEQSDKTPKKVSQKCESSDVRTDSKPEENDNNARKHESELYKKYKALWKRGESSKRKRKRSSRKGSEGKSLELDNLDDDELLKFVKENMQCLPHLSKLKPSELRKAIQSSTETQEADSTSEISDDENCRDFDDFSSSEMKTFRRPKIKKRFTLPKGAEDLHPLASVKIAEIGSDGVAKNVKPVVELVDDTKSLDEIGDKTHDIDDISEDDYALKLIEEIPQSVAPAKKKVRSYDRVPVADDLFNDISSIESFEGLNSPNDIGNSKPKPLKTSEGRVSTPDKSESAQQLNQADPTADQSKTATGIGASSAGRDSAQQSPKDCIQDPRLQITTGPPAAATDGLKNQRTNQNRSSTCSSPQDVILCPQSTARFSNEPSESWNTAIHSRPPGKPSFSSVSRRHSYGSSEPKSYAEYRRLKRLGQEKSSQLETTAKENTKSIAVDNSSVSDISKSPAERDDPSKKCLDPRRPKDSYSKPANVRSYHSGINPDGGRKPPYLAGQRRFLDQVENRSREERKSYEDRGKIGEEKRHSTESEEFVSPLEELYKNDSKPKTGRGYGLQNFRIPKKGREPVSSKPNGNQPVLGDPRTHISSVSSDSFRDPNETAYNKLDEPGNETGGTGTADAVEDVRCKKPVENSDRGRTTHSGVILKDDIHTKKLEPSKTVTKTEISINESVRTNGEESDPQPRKSGGAEAAEETGKKATEPVTSYSSGTCDGNDSTKPVNAVESRTSSNYIKTDAAGETVDDPEKDVTKSETKTCAYESVKKCEPQIAECDSSMGNSGNAGSELTSSGDKSATISKEEITQEFVEALIRKSFESGEGKLLLAHAKLFEEFARKLNSKKLKTIQKIINSETDSSSSSTESNSEDEKRRKKGKKTRRARKKGRRSKRQKSSSSISSSCESEDSSEEEGKSEKKQKEAPAAGDDEGSKILEQTATEESKSRSNTPVPVKSNKKVRKRRRNLEFGKNFSGRKAKRKQRQKKLLEKILSETPQPEAKEPEVKKKRRTKGKTKTELDRLHDDIRNMFLNDGEVTPTGQRMCRILKNSGGNINNLDLVKESAKMVKEERLKGTHTRRSLSRKTLPPHRTDSSDSRSRSQSLDKTTKTSDPQQENEDEEDSKLAMEPKVVLQRVDLSNFGYGIKISEDCISFRRLKGRNTAIRGSRKRIHRRALSDASESLSDGSRSPSEEAERVRRVFLPRNKRKVERMREAKGKKDYFGKRLMEVVENLPLKMGKIKHLELCEKKEEPEAVTKKKYCSRKSPKKNASRKDKSALRFSNTELLNYAFERIRVMYSCKLCPRVTRYITGHYKAAHPEHEVLISRLCIGEAKKARLDAKRNCYDNPEETGNPFARTLKRRMKTILNFSKSYNCRMCSSVKTQDLEVFKAHVSSHTGESRFQCSAEGCGVQTYSFQDIKTHIVNNHGRNKEEHDKPSELFPTVVEEGILFGFLCSVCNFVQLHRRNVLAHISRSHTASENPSIIKINMSANIPKSAKKKLKMIKIEKDTEIKADIEKFDEVKGEQDAEVIFQKTVSRENSGEIKETEEECKEKRMHSEGAKAPEDEDDFDCFSGSRKKIRLDENEKDGEGDGDEEEDEDEEEEEDDEENEEKKASPDQRSAVNVLHEKERECGQDVEPSGDNDGKDGADLKVSTLKDREKDGGLVSPERETVGASQKIKVGPLEAQLLDNSTVVYECYVKGCLFFTRAFDLFEKHIKISHCKTEWNGICEICNNAGRDAQPSGDNSFKLLTALRHLRLHEREKVSNGKLSKEESIMELKLMNSSDECVVDDDDAEKNDESPIETKEAETSATKKTENTDTPYPPKPLLRVRNLLGDRLSTPKDSPEENEVVAITEEPPPPESQKNPLFTIENVRSLNDPQPEESDIQIQHVCSLKDSPKSLPQVASGKAILVRSCPTRKIAIRPEPSAVSIDVGQLSVVQAPSTSHPVVLAPLTTASPIRIISSSTLPPKPQYTVKPILVPADAPRMNTPNVLSIISPSLSPIVPNPAVTTETRCVSQPSPVLQETTPASPLLSPAKPSLEVTVVPPAASKSAPPAAPAAPSTSLVDVEDSEEMDSVTLQRIHPSPNVGNKRVKDAKIYEEMLTKTKLCHLFKCMGIECSFTCNNECVFRQHIGLHEAQRRLKKNKGIRTIFLRLANKTTRAFYWQQCAYCCELLTNTNNALSQHILEEHGHCMYQCAFCFYRAVSHSYVEIHQNLAHSQILKTTPRVIYKCKPQRTPPSQVAALVKHGRRQSVRPYHCDQCGRKFYITQDFIKHLTTQHQSVTAYTCHICKNLCFKADRLIVHYKLHSYCTYQCAYCLHGTETEKEMVFHLCNFHFSQPAIMYVRAFADGQSHDVKEKQMKKKKHLSNQLDSLKVIVYESDTLNADCIVEVDADEETPKNASDANTDLSAIVAELGINADASSQSCVTPLIKELASIGDKNAKNLTVKTLLPNAQFSSENENGTENCSVLISSGLSTPSDENNERGINIPLGQLPLEIVNVKHNEGTANSSSQAIPTQVVCSPDKNLKLNEIIENLQNKEKAAGFLPGGHEQGQPAAVSSAVHKLPPVVLSRSSASKNVYSSKSALIKRKSEEAPQANESTEGNERAGSGHKSGSETKEASGSSGSNVQKTSPGEPTVTSSCSKGEEKPPLVTGVVDSSNSELEKENASIVISDICSLSAKTDPAPAGTVKNTQPKVNTPVALKPPIIRVEDFPIGEENKAPSQENPTSSEPGNKNDGEKPDAARAASPDIIILEEEKPDDIITVTLDSDEEKEDNGKKEAGKGLKNSEEVTPASVGGETIRKEMELLRKQIASETDSLLFDEAEGEKARKEDLSVSVDSGSEDPAKPSLLSPIEEAICSLNRKLQSETEQAQKKEEDKKESAEVSPTKSESSASELPERPRTRFAARDRRKEGGEGADRNEGDEIKKEEPEKCKKVKEDLEGKELFICGNENCNFAAEDDSELKDHLYVCDLSRESSVLVCPHCSRQMKQFHPYLEHLKYHGQKKYHCGLCEYSSSLHANATRHVKQKHKCSLLKVLPKDSQPGHVVYYPKNYKVDKVDFEVNGYSPGDEDKLPLQSVYQVNVKCAKCPYFTKVRSNMVRHLKIHVKSVETEGVVVVPSTAPTNPVPCLETKERMFDKMTNLAASSQLAQAKEKTPIESLSPEEAAKLPQFVAEQMRYKCCLPDCNYITVDDGMLKHHIKALHDEINYYSCPHCQDTVHVDVRHVILDKIGHHLKHHDAKLYKCAHCIYFHYQKNVVEKHTAEKHPDRRFFVHTVREPKPEATLDEEGESSEGGSRVWKCSLCENFRSPSKSILMDHLLKSHNIKSKYRCKLCTMKGNSYQAFLNHFSSKHPGEEVAFMRVYQSEKVPAGSLESGNSSGADSASEHFDTTPLWQRGTPRIRHIRGILIEEEEIKTKKLKRTSLEESEAETSDCAPVQSNENAFYCPLCTNKKKPFYTRSEDCFRTHLYQELNYQQFACILCGKMFVDRKDFDKHHTRAHPYKSPAVKQTKEDHEIKFWVDQVIAKRRKQMEDRKRKLSEDEEKGKHGQSKKKKEV